MDQKSQIPIFIKLISYEKVNTVDSIAIVENIIYNICIAYYVLCCEQHDLAYRKYVAKSLSHYWCSKNVSAIIIIQVLIY